MEEWSVCLPDHHPGYVSWEAYLATRKRLRANVRPRGEGGGAAREGEPPVSRQARIRHERARSLPIMREGKVEAESKR